MIRCKKVRDLFVLALYDELSGPTKKNFRTHLNACPECRLQFEKMQQTLGVMSTRENPDPGADFWDGFWGDVRVKSQKAKPQRVEISIIPKLSSRILPAFRAKVITQFAAALALVICGIFIGRHYFAPQKPVEILTADASRMSPELRKQTSTYLEQTNLFLLAISNFDTKNEDPYILDLPRKKGLSKKLAQQAAVLKHGLSQANETRLLTLISDLELILMQLAHLDAENDIPAIEFVQSALDRHAIFLKINLEKIRNKKSSSPSQKTKKRKNPSSV